MFAGAASARRGRASATNRLTSVGRALGLRGLRVHGQGRLPGGLGVRLGQVARQPGPAQHQHEAVLLDGLDEELDPGDADPAETIHERGAPLGRDPAGPPVGDAAGRIERAEVPPRGDVARPEVEVDPQGLEDAAPDGVAERLVAEETEVAGAAAGRDAGRDVAEKAAGAPPRQRVEMRDPGRLQLGQARGRIREAAQPVRREEDDLGGAGNGQAPNQIQIHRTGLLRLQSLARRPAAGAPARRGPPPAIRRPAVARIG